MSKLEVTIEAPIAEQPRQVGALLRYALQPAIVATALTTWYLYRENLATYLYIVIAAQLTLGLLERFYPARPQWSQGAAEKTRNVLIVLVIATATLAGADWYATHLGPLLTQLRISLGADVWPTHWLLVPQVVLAFLLSEFIWYWLHRAEHRFPLVWRCTGHGAHHSFKHLGAINFGANHPLEILVLLVPSLLVEMLFGAGIAAAGAAVLVATQASIVHSNLALNSRGIGWLLTTNYYHIHHHSVVLEESNTNYGCALIFWDRVFRTFEDRATVEAGTGPSEPSLWQKLLMPLREPVDTSVAPPG